MTKAGAKSFRDVSLNLRRNECVEGLRVWRQGMSVTVGARLRTALMLTKYSELREDPNVYVSCFDTFILKLFTQLDHIFKSLVLDHGTYSKHL